ncbi:Glycoside hydrolase superfamily [Phytophthora cactorum]|nr:Glycoside hydrolase superfamily [Phytophthora cactorum]
MSLTEDSETEFQTSAFVTPENQVVIQFLNLEGSDEVVNDRLFDIAMSLESKQLLPLGNDHSLHSGESYVQRLLSIPREVIPLSLFAFGGPPAHLALAHDRFVYKQKWLADDRFLEVLSIASAIPGPSSTMTIAAMGFSVLDHWDVALIISLLLAVDGLPVWLTGLAPAAVSIVVIAAARLWQKACEDDTAKNFVASVSACVILATQGMSSLIFPAVMAAGGFTILISTMCGYSPPPVSNDRVLSCHLERQIGIHPIAGVLIVLSWLVVLVLLAQYHPQDDGEHSLLSLFYTFYWIGSIIFGGGQVMLPMLLDNIVMAGWVSKEQFLIGLALVQSLPGPLFNISAYLGALIYGVPGALISSVGLFGPGIVLFFGLLPLWERVRNNTSLQIFLSGVMRLRQDSLWLPSSCCHLHICTIAGPFGSVRLWNATPDTSYQIQLSGTLDLYYDVDMYDIDMFDTPNATIAELKQRGIKVICYFSAGTYEDWRSDKDRYSSNIIGARLPEWEARLQQVPGHDSARSQLDRGLKNDLNQINDLVSVFDFSVNEQCVHYNECDMLVPFIKANKPVFGIEYSGDKATACAIANSLNFDTLFKALSLKNERYSCRDMSSLGSSASEDSGSESGSNGGSADSRSNSGATLIMSSHVTLVSCCASCSYRVSRRMHGIQH